MEQRTEIPVFGPEIPVFGPEIPVFGQLGTSAPIYVKNNTLDHEHLDIEPLETDDVLSSIKGMIETFKKMFVINMFVFQTEPSNDLIEKPKFGPSVKV